MINLALYLAMVSIYPSVKTFDADTVAYFLSSQPATT